MQRLDRLHFQPRPGRWSIAALVLAGIGVAASTSLVLASDGDPGSVLWPVVVLPVAIAFAPLVVPRDRVRVGAAVAMGGWCVLTGFSIGFLLLPALVAQLGAAVREGEA
ncbi:hypothetical protein BH09ACT13_BH09ACT13_11820 [soil metagenome]